MNKQKWILATIVLLMVGGTAGVLAHLRTNQTLGKPGEVQRKYHLRQFSEIPELDRKGCFC